MNKSTEYSVHCDATIALDAPVSIPQPAGTPSGERIRLCDFRPHLHYHVVRAAAKNARAQSHPRTLVQPKAYL